MTTRLDKKIKAQPHIMGGTMDFYMLNFEKPTGAMGHTLDQVAMFCDKHPAQGFFENPLDCLDHALNIHRVMMHQGRRLLKGFFSEDELTACLSVMNATVMMHSPPGGTLQGNIEDVLPSELPVVIDLEIFRGKVKALGIFERAYLELWAWAFWYAPGFDDRNLDDYIKQLV